MNNLATWILLIILWLGIGLLSGGWLNESFNDSFHWSTKERCENMAASNQAFAVFAILMGPFGLIPVSIISGFGYRGWSLERHKCNGY